MAIQEQTPKSKPGSESKPKAQLIGQEELTKQVEREVDKKRAKRKKRTKDEDEIWAKDKFAKLKQNTSPEALAELIQLEEASRIIQANQNKVNKFLPKDKPLESEAAATILADIAESGLENNKYYILAKAAQLQSTMQLGDAQAMEVLGHLRETSMELFEIPKDAAANYHTWKDTEKNEQYEAYVAIQTGARVEGRQGMMMARTVVAEEVKFDEGDYASDWGKEKARELRRRLERMPELASDAGELKKMQNTLSAEDVRPEAENDVREIIKKLRQMEIKAQKEIAGFPRDLENRWGSIKSNFRNINEEYGNMRDRIKAHFITQSKSVPGEVDGLLDDILIGLDPGDDPSAVSRVDPIALKARLARLMTSPDSAAAVSAEQGNINRAIDAIEQQIDFNRKVASLGIDRRLEMVGIKGKTDEDQRMLKVYDLLGNKDEFMTEVRRRVQAAGGDRALASRNVQQYFNDIEQDTKMLVRRLLEVGDTDSEEYFNHLFTNFYHVPIYSNIVTGLTGIENNLKDLEREGVIQRVKEFKFDLNTREYNQHEINLSQAIGDLREWVLSEKGWKEYTHNIYIMMLGRAEMKQYKEYTKNVKTQEIDRLLAENPELEEAIRLHMGYLRAEYGLNGWKTPTQEIYETNKDGLIPIDDYVKENLLNTEILGADGKKVKLNEADATRLASMARGFVLGVNWEAIDTMASGGPVGGTPGRFTGFFGPMDSINVNRYILYRWGSELPVHEWLYTRVKGKGSKEAWDVRREMLRAKETMKARETKEPPRVVTDQMVEDGIPFIEDTYLQQTGGVKMRWGWRKQMYDHIYAKGGDNKAEIIRQLMTVDLHVANRQIEDWAGDHKFSKTERNKLREMVLEHLRVIAPQEYLILEKELTRHSAISSLGLSKDELSARVKDANKVTNYLLARTRGNRVMVMGDMTDADWQKVFSGNQEAIDKTKRFMTAAQKTAKAAIEGSTGITLVDGTKLTAWREAAYIRSFPTHLEVKRNANYSKLKGSVVDRLAGDNMIIADAYKEFWTELPNVIRDYNTNPKKAIASDFEKAELLIRKVRAAYDMVHGPSADQQERASDYRISYMLGMMIDKYFAKSLTARMPLGVGTVVGKFDDFSSWSKYGIGDLESGLQFDEQIHRIWRDRLVKAQLIAPEHGRVQGVDDIKKVGPFIIKMRRHHMEWNGGAFAAESGSRWWQVGIDIVRSSWHYPLIIIALAALAKGIGDVKDDKDGH